jgi:hypothetical protein
MAKPPQEPKLTRVDTYEENFMAGGGRPIHREKMIWKYHWILLVFVPVFLITSIMFFAGLGSHPPPPAVGLIPLAFSALFTLLWITFAVLRVHVSDSEIHIQYGMFGPRINLHSLESVQVVEYQLSKFGGWGIRRAWDGTWAYSLMGESDRVVELTWREGGKTKKCVVSSPDPQDLVRQIKYAQAQAAIQLRIDGSVADSSETPLLEEPSRVEGLLDELEEEEQLVEKKQVKLIIYDGMASLFAVLKDRKRSISFSIRSSSW